MIQYVEAPEKFTSDTKKSVFLAGGITDCPDWQQEIMKDFRSSSQDLAFLNPRRANFPINDPTAAFAQIKWEHDHLRQASAILFWFPCETLCPIVLYELGAWSMSVKPIFVGVHPDYKRKQDVLYQTEFVRPAVRVVLTLQELANQVLEWGHTA